MNRSPDSGISVLEATVAGIHAAMRAGRLTARQLVQAYLDRIMAYDKSGPRINSVLQLNPQALAEADQLDAQAAASPSVPLAPLHGIPVLIKDNIECAGIETTAGARCLQGNLAREDAFIVRRLREAGAIVLAKTNLHELASGGETVSTLGGQTLNPYDLTRTPGGSSGGTGAGIAANLGLLGIGTDGINSIRSPASANNLVGLRPTMGLVSRTGLVPCGLTQDTIGPITRTVADAAVLLDIIAGHDPGDPATRQAQPHMPRSYAEALDPDGLRGARIGVLRAFFGEGPGHRAVNAVMQRALATLDARGAELVEIEEAIHPDALLADTLVHLYEMKGDLDAYLAGVPAAVPVRSMADMIIAGSVHPGVTGTLKSAMALAGNETEYCERLQRQQALRDRILGLMAAHRLDALAFPHQRRLVVPVGQAQAERNGVLASATGFPAIVIPAGFSEPDGNAPQGVPVGLEFFGRPFSEAVLLRLAHAAEHALDARRPPLCAPALT
ncbi:amidase family protein [Cupriavidus sp. WKF15]|uniref:amidase family protein n=1 Tax=Cupriavidus sp. WKF15 TaxID=3032282 RepID=UPI0023E1D96F|nr:amidase family protein [Cupriavidus sp. WKF15]WER48792.1 amidase family protein [Cupriavidus sp. WKF15]